MCVCIIFCVCIYIYIIYIYSTSLYWNSSLVINYISSWQKNVDQNFKKLKHQSNQHAVFQVCRKFSKYKMCCRSTKDPLTQASSPRRGGPACPCMVRRAVVQETMISTKYGLPLAKFFACPITISSQKSSQALLSPQKCFSDYKTASESSA